MGVLPTCKQKRLQKYRYLIAGAFTLHGMTFRIPLKPVIPTTKIVVSAIKVYQVQSRQLNFTSRVAKNSLCSLKIIGRYQTRQNTLNASSAQSPSVKNTGSEDFPFIH